MAHLTKCLVTLHLACHSLAHAATLEVGDNKPYSLPSEAIAAAEPGDTIHIAPGKYRDCAAWSKNNLTIRGSGENTVLTNAICQGVGILVINAPNAKIEALTLEGAATPEGNGSGIRANGQRLEVDTCTFRNNQDGILTANDPNSLLLIRNSRFYGNGACLPEMGCAHGIYAGHIGLLHVEGSRFQATKVGHHIKSRALSTELLDNRIEDGPEGTSSYLVDLPNGGGLLMTGNTLEKGSRSQNPTAAVSIGEEGAIRPTSTLLISDNTFRNDGSPTLFVLNKTANLAQLRNNRIMGPVRLLSGPGQAN